MRRLLALAASLVPPAAAAAQNNTLAPDETDAGWVLLFNGTNLDGFTTSGDLSAWAVEDGEIRTVDKGHGWWLRTTKMYRDFELMVDFKIPPGGNSGVGLRGSSNGDPAFTGMEVQILDSSDGGTARHDCGAVYNAIPPSSQAVHMPGEWNTYRIRLVGDTLDVWLNGVHIQDAQKLDDRGIFRQDNQPLPLNERLTTGYIAFQDHGEGGLRLRNIKILDLSPDPDPGDFVSVFNGDTLEGWTHRGGGSYAFEDGTLVGLDGPGHLFSDAEYADIEFRAFVKISDHGNSGLYFRTVPRPEDPDTWPLGYEAQVDNHDPKNFTGCVYDRAWPDRDGPITRDEAWFDYRVRAKGDHIQTWVNGVPFVDTTLTDFDKGHLAIQTHNPGNRVEVRDMQWRKP